MGLHNNPRTRQGDQVLSAFGDTIGEIPVITVANPLGDTDPGNPDLASAGEYDWYTIIAGTNVTPVYDHVGKTLKFDASEFNESIVFTSIAKVALITEDVIVQQGIFNVTLYDPATAKKRITIKNASGANINIVRFGAESIEGVAADFTLADDESATLVTDGTDWFIV